MLRYSFGNIDGKAYGLNANELSVYEAIGKCSRKDDARGWYASMQALADQLPFVISKPTVSRAVDKLLTLGLIERRGDKSLFLVQIETKSSQNETHSSQIETQSSQIETNPAPPYNPSINNNNEMEKENTRTCVPTHDTATQTPSFVDLLNSYIIKAKKIVTADENSKAREAWENCTPAKKVKLLEAVRSGAHFKARLDWLIADFPEPAPTNWQGTAQGGDMLNDGTAKIALYNGRYGIYSLDDIRLFNLELSDYQRGRK